MSDIVELQFKFYWLDGSTNEGPGDSPVDALNKLGFGSGALKALDYWKEVAALEADK